MTKCIRNKLTRELKPTQQPGYEFGFILKGCVLLAVEPLVNQGTTDSVPPEMYRLQHHDMDYWCRLAQLYRYPVIVLSTLEYFHLS
jgi:hypothetical protein